MRRQLTILSLILLFLTFYYHKNWNLVLPNTYLPSGTNLSGWDKTRIHQEIDNIQHKQDVIINVGGHDYVTSFADLGIAVDHSQLDHDLFSINSFAELMRLTKGIITTFTHKTVTLRLSAMRSAVYLPITTSQESKLTYDPSLGRFLYQPPRYDYQISPLALLSQVGQVFAAESPVITPDEKVVEHHDQDLLTLNARLAQTASQAVVIRVKDGKDYADVPISREEIKQVLAFTLKGDSPVVDIDRTIFSDVIKSKLSDKQKSTFQLNSAYNNMVATLSDRFSFKDVDSVILGIDDGPTSDGSLAPKYLEVDLSQQKMYVFSNGKISHEYRVSTGYDYPTPTGEFRIMNKAPKAFSDIYSVWMEYWMAFKYANDIGAYLGIHEIAYATGPNNQKIYRLGNYIGEPKTGGCIALPPGSAKEVYDFASPGMLVRVVE